MAIASQTYHRAASTTTTTLAGIDVSSWLSWTIYGVGFGLAIHLAPEAIDDLTTGGSELLAVIGGVCAFFGLVLAIQHQMNISLRDTRFGEPRKLTTEGFFALSRNPMYVAFLIPILSQAAISAPAAVAAAVFYVMAMNTLVIVNEEETLEANFGNQYRRYRKATPRWLVW